MNERSTIVLNDKWCWVDIEMKDIKKGDIYRSLEPNKTPVWGDGVFKSIRTFIALKDAEIKNSVAGVASGGVSCVNELARIYIDMEGDEHAYSGRTIL